MAKRRDLKLSTQSKESVDDYYFLNVEAINGWTALTLAASHGRLDLCNLLILHGANIDYETKLRHTALTWASFCGQPDVCFALIQHGADILYENREGKTAMMFAAMNGQFAVLEGFLQRYHSIAVRKATRTTSNAADPVGWHSYFESMLSKRDNSGKMAIDYAPDQSTVDLLDMSYDRIENQKIMISNLHEATKVVECRYQCGYAVSKESMLFHEDNECPKRPYVCLECNSTFPFDAKYHHEVTLKSFHLLGQHIS